MLGGIAFQLAVIVTYSILAIEYYVRYTTDKPIASRLPPSTSAEASGSTSNTASVKSIMKDYSPRGVMNGKTKIMLCALTFNTLCLFTR